MTYFEAIIYGFIQGLGEYLPISSSAHLILLPQFMGWQDPGLAFDVFLHFGTLIATLIYFWRDWLQMSRYFGKGFAQQSTMDLKSLIVATLPALVAGALLHGFVSTVFRGPMVMVWTLSVGGVILFFVDRLMVSRRDMSSIRSLDAFLIGVAQCFALVPGVSRSGATIIGARALGFDRASSAKISFMISAPVIAAAIVFELRNWNELVASTQGLGHLFAGAVSSFVFGMIAIKGLLSLLKRYGFGSFLVYRLALAAVIWKVLG